MSKFPLISLLPLFLASALTAETVTVWLASAANRSNKNPGLYQTTLDLKKGELGQAELAFEMQSVGFLAQHPTLPILYGIGRFQGNNAVVAWQVEGSGVEFLNHRQIQTGGAAHVGVHPAGNMLVTAQYGAGTVEVFPLKPDGSLATRSQIIQHNGGSRVVENRQNRPHPHWAGFSPDGKFVFIPDLGMDQTLIYKVDFQYNELMKHGAIDAPPGGGPRHMKFSKDGNYIFILNELTLSVSSYKYDAAQGSASLVETVQTLSDETKSKEIFNSASEIRIHPSGNFAYTGNRGNDSITAFRINQSTGRLTKIEHEPIRGVWPRNFQISPDGNWIVVGGAHSNTVSLFRIEATGELTYVRQITNAPNIIGVEMTGR